MINEETSDDKTINWDNHHNQSWLSETVNKTNPITKRKYKLLVSEGIKGHQAGPRHTKRMIEEHYELTLCQ